MRRRRCFADTDLDAATLDCQQVHALFAGAAVPQRPHPVIFRLPLVAPHQLPPSAGRPGEAGTRLSGLVRSCWLRPTPTATSESHDHHRPVGQPSKSGGVDVCETISRLPKVGDLPYARLPPTFGGKLTLIGRTTTSGREDQRTATVVDHPHDSPPGRCQPQVVTGRDEEHHIRLDSKSSRKAKTFDFSVESLLAK